MKQKTITVFEAVKERLHSDGFISSYRLSDKFFVRQRLLPFTTVMLILLNNISKSLSVELTKFFDGVVGRLSASKQAFSRARYRIKWEGFEDLNDVLIKTYYGNGGYRLYRDRYLLLASDGSDYELPYEDGLIGEFGVADNGMGKQPVCMGKGVKIWDLLNRLTVSSLLGRYDVAEIRHFRTAWERATGILSGRAAGRLLLLADMHYPSFWLIHRLCTDGHFFLFRCPPAFCREVAAFMQGGADDAVLTVPIGTDEKRKSSYRIKTGAAEAPAFIRVRAIRLTAPTGVAVCLLTNLGGEEMPYGEVCGLYPYRWGVEVSLDFDKNRVQIENFSAKMPLGVRQDWYAGTLGANLAQLIIEDAQELVDEELRDKGNKYQYRVNRSVALGIIKDEMPKMLFGRETPAEFHSRMVERVRRCREPVRPGRSFPRERKHNIKFPMNSRRVL